MKLVEATLNGLPAARPEPTRARPQHLCADKGYDYPITREQIAAFDLVPHVKSRGEEKKAKRKGRKHPARRWVVERTHSWFNRFRRLLVRWEKKACNYDAMIHFACAGIVLRLANVLG